MTAPVKRTAAKKVAAKPKKPSQPGDPAYDWKPLYKQGTKLFRFNSADGFVVCLPEFRQPGEGEVFGLMLLDKSDQDLMLHTLRETIAEAALDTQTALVTTFNALRRIKAEGSIEALLEKWPEAAGIKLEK